MYDQRLSKRLSYHLRHAPGEMGLTLEPGGWVAVEALLAALGITRAALDAVVAENPKRRFAFDESGTRIRANQGHSVEVDLQLAPSEPPPLLYHGTAERLREIILREGLKKMARHHVHLSADRETAREVGARHGKPHIFTVDAAGMRADGRLFFRSQNGVWLVDEVAAKYLT